MRNTCARRSRPRSQLRGLRLYATGELPSRLTVLTIFFGPSSTPQRLCRACVRYSKHRTSRVQGLRFLQWALLCAKTDTFSLAGRLSSPRREFHEEWLRDEPCDATTTGLKPLFRATGVNSLLETGNMRFEGHTPRSPTILSPPRTACAVAYVVFHSRDVTDFYPPPYWRERNELFLYLDGV